MGRVLPWVAGAIGVLIAAFAWYRTLTFSAVTGPQRVQWYSAEDEPIDTSGTGHSLGAVLMSDALILGDRVIVPTSGPKGGKGGFAWISPARGEARIAWPYRDTLSYAGVAVRDSETFALALYAHDTDRDRAMIAVGIAGRDGWVRAPVAVAEWKEERSIRSFRPLLHAMSFVGADVEVVVTHPQGDDVFGSSSPVDIVRVSATGAPVRRSRGIGCTEGCWVIGALPSPKGWTLVVNTMARENSVSLVDESGTSVVAPPALQWWEQSNHDRTALGTFWASSGWGERRVERDGSLGKDPLPPIPGWKPLVTYTRLEVIDGVLRRERIFGRTEHDIDMIAQRAGGRTIVTQSVDDDLQLVGTSPDAMVPTIHNSTSYEFRIGVFLPRAGGGFHWVAGSGEYVTLDDQLKRIDPLSLRHHLRTRGSVGDFIDESEHEWYLGWALFGLPLLLIAGLGFAQLTDPKSRARLVTLAAVVYAVSAGACLLKVLPLL